MKKRKEIEEQRLLIQQRMAQWEDYEKGWYMALCWVLEDRGIK